MNYVFFPFFYFIGRILWELSCYESLTILIKLINVKSLWFQHGQLNCTWTRFLSQNFFLLDGYFPNFCLRYEVAKTNIWYSSCTIHGAATICFMFHLFSKCIKRVIRSSEYSSFVWRKLEMVLCYLRVPLNVIMQC